MMVEKISIIVPVYNVKNYLNRCVDSILKQTYSNTEILLVDDGSTDGSSEICDIYEKLDSRIKVIRQKNKGLGPARNTGLKHATGEYVAFVDSDDWISETMYEHLLQSIHKHSCDIATCGRTVENDTKVIDYIYCLPGEQIVENEDIILHYLLHKNMNMSACDKLFKRSLFENIQFPSGYVSEDIVPIYEVLRKVRRIVLTGKAFYHYYVRPNSLSRNTGVFTEKQMGLHMYSKEVCDDVHLHYPQLKREADAFETDALLTTWRNMRKSKYKGKHRKEIFKTVMQKFDDIFLNPNVQKKQKLFVLMMVMGVDGVFDKLYTWLKNKKNEL